jgi:uncharacterized protein YjbJ (UPF0337 family)
MGIAENAKHKAEELAGKAKETLGSLTGDKGLENEGKVDQASAKVKQGIAGATDKAKSALHGIKGKLGGK